MGLLDIDSNVKSEYSDIKIWLQDNVAYLVTDNRHSGIIVKMDTDGVFDKYFKIFKSGRKTMINVLASIVFADKCTCVPKNIQFNTVEGICTIHTVTDYNGFPIIVRDALNMYNYKVTREGVSLHDNNMYGPLVAKSICVENGCYEYLSKLRYMHQIKSKKMPMFIPEIHIPKDEMMPDALMDYLKTVPFMNRIKYM